VDLKHIDGLQGIFHENGEIHIGACTLMSEIEGDPLIAKAAPVLAMAAKRIACPQIRNRATIGGNLCNASPAADTAIPLILLDAKLDLVSGNTGATSEREVAVEEFFTGPGSTVLLPGEVLVRVRFRPTKEGTFAEWDKFGTRPSMEIAVASVGISLSFAGERITDARVGYGSVAPVPLRGRQAEDVLEGSTLTASVIDKCISAARDEVEPITDVRAGAAYRRQIVGTMLGRMLENAKHAQQS
jgi:CO/xanthine dehydrogenase FAD-binding subunit